jgi:putative ABC transport system permease protein
MKKSLRMLIPAGIAIIIGTAFIASTFLFGNTLNDSLRAQLTAQFGKANYAIGVTDDKAGTDPHSSTVADFHPEQIRAVDGVRGMRVSTMVSIEVGNGDRHISSTGIGGSNDMQLLPVTMPQGRQPRNVHEIALPENMARQLNVGIGDMVGVNAQGSGAGGSDAMPRMRVVGFTNDPYGAFATYNGAAILADDAVASLQGHKGFNTINASTVYLDIAPGKADAAIAKIRSLIPKGFEVQSSTAISDAQMKSLGDDGMTPVTIFLLVFGVIAMFVAALVIANTFQVLVAQRRRTFALLRTIGAKKGQIYRSVILESVLLGLASSLIGIATGMGIMTLAGAAGALKSIYGAAPHALLVITPPVIIVPLAFGIVMTVMAALGSARAATNVTPLEALRPVELSEGAASSHRMRTIIGTLLTVIGAAMAVVSIIRMRDLLGAANTQSSEGSGYSTILLMAIVACVFVFLGLALAASSWLPMLMKGVGALVAKTGPSATIANANVQKNPRRVAATGLALLIGVTLVSTIATGAASGKQTMSDALDTRYSVDLVATGTQLSRKSADKAAQVSGVTHMIYAPAATGTVTDAKGRHYSVLLVGVTGSDQLKKVMHTDIAGAQIAGSQALLPRYSAMSGKELTFNGTTVFQGDEGESENKAQGTSGDASSENVKEPQVKFGVGQRDFRRVSGDYEVTAFVSADLFASHTLKEQGHILLASVDPHATNLADTFQNVQSALAEDMGVRLSGPVAERLQWENVIDTMLKLLVGLLAVAVLIALIGVANTLSLSVIERTRESATLRAIGMTRGQLRRSLSVEALLIALVSGLSGIVLGTLFGWLGSYTVFSLYGTIALPFEWQTNGVVLLITAIAALLASVFPARRALRTAPVKALAEA